VFDGRAREKKKANSVGVASLAIPPLVHYVLYDTDMKTLLTTKGRISRSVFWGVHLFSFLAMALSGGVLTYIEQHNLPKPPATAITLLCLLPIFLSIIVQIKRWHDLNRSGVWILVNFIPVFGLLWTLILCGLVRGTDGENQYGLDPVNKTPLQ